MVFWSSTPRAELALLAPAALSALLLAQARPALAEPGAPSPPESGPRPERPRKTRPVLEVATDPEHPFQPDAGAPAPLAPLAPLAPPTNTGIGPRLSAGVALTTGTAAGVFGRVELETYRVGFRGNPAVMIDVLPLGIDAWEAPRAYGFALPTTVALALYGRPAFAGFGLGYSWLLLDRVEQKTGFSAFAPHAEVTLGLDVLGVRLSAGARAIYRWHARSEDRGQLQIGGAIGFLDR